MDYINLRDAANEGFDEVDGGINLGGDSSGGIPHEATKINPPKSTHTKGFENSNTGRPSSNDTKLRGMIDTAGEAFGGKLFYYSNGLTRYICHAIPAQYADSSLDAYYEGLSVCADKFNQNGSCFLRFHHAETVDDYVVFFFITNDNEQSISRLTKESKKDNAEHIYKTLLCIIGEYYSHTVQSTGRSYEPLACFSLDTVFLSTSGKIRVLPLRAVSNGYPVEVPREAGTPFSDDATDLYSAAYLYIQLYNGGCEEELEDFELPDDDIVTRSLLPIKCLRPRLQDALDRYGIKHNISNTTPGKIRYNTTDDDQRKNPRKSKKEDFRFSDFRYAHSVTEFFGTLGNMFKAFFKWLKVVFSTTEEAETKGQIDATQTKEQH